MHTWHPLPMVTAGFGNHDQCCADLREEADEVIRPAIDRVETADPSRHLAALEHMLFRQSDRNLRTSSGKSTA
jgi:hypothetical protein